MQINNLNLEYINNISSIPRSSEIEDLIISENTDIASVLDGPAVITRTGNLTINSGITLGLTNQCERWDIIVNGNLTVNGTLSLNAKGILRTSDIISKIFGFYRANAIPSTVPIFDSQTDFNWKHVEFTILQGGQAEDGGILNLYIKGNVTIGVSGIISANGNVSKNGGRINIYYCGTYLNQGTIEANGGVGGLAGYITVKDINYLLTEYQKTLASGEYIYTMIDLGSGKAMIGTRDTGKVFYTEDWGENWTDQGTLQTSTTVRCFVDFGGGKIWAGTGENTTGQSKLYETLNWGEDWTLKYTFPTNNKRIASMCKITNSIILVGTRNTTNKGQVYKTIDGGVNWTAIGNLDTSDNVRAMLLLSNGTVLAGTKAGKIYASTNNGDTWALKSTVTTKKVRCFIELPGGIVLAGTWDAKIFRNANYGEGSWTQVQAWGTKQEISEFYQIVGNKILASTSPQKASGTDTQKHLTVSDNGGATWRRITDFSSTKTNAYLLKEKNIFFTNIAKHFINNPINHFGAT